jgi:hypothetical protein
MVRQTNSFCHIIIDIVIKNEIGEAIMKRRFLGMILLVMLMGIPFSFAQQINNIIEPNDTTLVNSAANISFPPPVYVVRDTVDIRGTITLPTMRNYFVEFRPLVLDETTALPSEQRPWFPATLPMLEPIIDDVLGTWNTFTAPDGLYEIRLTINTNSGVPEYVRVSPIRVQNNIPPFLEETLAGATPTPIPQNAPTRATLAATPTAFSTGPQVVALVDANVRSGDTTEYDRIGFLFSGESAPIIGVSSFNTNWYYIQLPSGRRGFIAPSVVRAEGDLENLPRINPPPPPTPIPTNTPVPTATTEATANLVVSQVVLDPNPPQCNETYTMYVTVKNTGAGASTEGGTISITDARTADGTVLESTLGAFPALDPDGTFEGIIPVTVSTYHSEDHTLTIQIDSTSVIPETNEADNTFTIVYNLEQAAC